MDGLSADQQALFASIMGNSSQAQAMTPSFGAPATPATPAAAPAAAPVPDPNDQRQLSQAEIDALIASMIG